jgi:hypothetical protein
MHVTQEFRRRFVRRCTVILAPLLLAALVPLGLSWPPDLRFSTSATDGHRLLVVAVVTAVWLLIGITAIMWWLHRHRLSPVGVRWPAPVTWAAGAASVLRSIGITMGDQPGSATAKTAWWASPVWTVVIALGAAALGWLLAGPDPTLPRVATPPDPIEPRLSLPPHARAMWHRQVRSDRGLTVAALTAALGLAGMVTAASTVGTVGALALVVAAFLAAQSCASVRVDQHGIVVAQPFLRRTLIAVPYQHIHQATAVTEPTELPRHGYGAVAAGTVFGYRARPSGPALRLAVAGGWTCVVTVDDPHTAAALINTQLDRRWVARIVRSESC